MSDPFYSKAKPKLLDYNPLTHSSFYTKPVPFAVTTSHQGPPITNRYIQNKPWHSSYRNVYVDPISGRKISHSPQRRPLALGASLQQRSGSEYRYYKTRPKNNYTDPISGYTRNFDNRRSINSLDTILNRDKFPKNPLSEVPKFEQSKVDRVSGALRKHVPELTYVNPYMLKQNQVQLHPRNTFEKSLGNFYS